jgi:hypothetical protein
MSLTTVAVSRSGIAAMTAISFPSKGKARMAL